MNFILEWQFWKSALEIGIIAAFIYYLLVFMRGTRGAAMLTGLAVVLVSLTLVTRLLGLDTISWLLSWFFGFFAVALIIIFQPELRRVLAELGSHQFFTTSSRGQEVIDIISESAQSLSDKRIGAIIAIEGNIGFRGIVERGVEMDCKVTAETLLTVFFPNTPLHDGGVVIRGDRIVAAACIFPLSERHGLETELGTRHRAALGLTEETDAVVVAVSEETGKISLVYRGVIQRNLNRATLSEALGKLLMKPPSNKQWWVALRRWLSLRESRAIFNAPEPTVNQEKDGDASVANADDEKNKQRT